MVKRFIQIYYTKTYKNKKNIYFAIYTLKNYETLQRNNYSTKRL